MNAETGLQNSSRKRIIFLFTKALLHRVVFTKVTVPYGMKILCSAYAPSGAIAPSMLTLGLEPRTRILRADFKSTVFTIPPSEHLFFYLCIFEVYFKRKRFYET